MRTFCPIKNKIKNINSTHKIGIKLFVIKKKLFAVLCLRDLYAEYINI